MEDVEIMVAAKVITTNQAIDLCVEAANTDDSEIMYAIAEFFRQGSNLIKDKKEKECKELLKKFNEDR